MKHTIVIGSGFSSLSAATALAAGGHKVTVLEKNSTVGGRARTFNENGFQFDMGPSWYWMPDVFENWFNAFGKTASDYYDLVRLDPSYRVFFGKDDIFDIPASFEQQKELFEKIEKGAGVKLEEFLLKSGEKYRIAMSDLVYKPGKSLFEFIDSRTLKALFTLDLFSSFSSHVRKYFRDQRLLSLVEFPVLFLGAKPSDTPAMYSLMNHADFRLGTWYPMGGMGKIVDGMVSVAKEKGVDFRTGEAVKEIVMNGRQTKGVRTLRQHFNADYVVAGADYHHVEQNLLRPEYRKYSENYWAKRTMAPSSLIFYLGINKKVKNLLHHNLFFDQDFAMHAKEIYDRPEWPSSPLFYVCCPSKTDPEVAPEGQENIFILMPVASGLNDNPEIRQKYFDLILSRMESLTGESIREHVIFKKDYAITDFQKDYNAFKGNAYGLANTLRQTAVLKPSIHNPKVRNLFYTGQLTVPGPGVPPALISGRIVAKEILHRST